MMGSVANLGVLLTSVALAIVSALILVRQLIFAMLFGESG